MRKTYTVIMTSGWQGDGWYYVDEFDTRKEAEQKAAQVSRTEAKMRGYITAIVGATRTCDECGGHHCLNADTSRVKQGPRSRKAHIQFEM